MSRSDIEWYKDSAGRIPLLTAAEEIELGTAVRAWLDYEGGPDKAPARVQRRGRRARDRMIAANMRLVISHVMKHCQRHFPPQGPHDPLDIIQYVNSSGLVKAAEKFDPIRGYKFSTYAYWWVRQSVNRWLSDCSRLIRSPVHHTEIVNRVEKIRTQLSAELSRSPTMEEIVERYQELTSKVMTAKDLEFILNSRLPTWSLDRPSAFLEDGVLADSIAAPEPEEEDDTLELMLQRVADLDDDERRVMELRYGLGRQKQLTQDQVAQEMGISISRVRLLSCAAQRKLRAIPLHGPAPWLRPSPPLPPYEASPLPPSALDPEAENPEADAETDPGCRGDPEPAPPVLIVEQIGIPVDGVPAVSPVCRNRSRPGPRAVTSSAAKVPLIALPLNPLTDPEASPEIGSDGESPGSIFVSGAAPLQPGEEPGNDAQPG